MSGHRANTRLDHDLSKEFFEQGQRLDVAGDPEADCWLCHQTVDYTADRVAPDFRNSDHLLTVSEHPELESDPDKLLSLAHSL